MSSFRKHVLLYSCLFPALSFGLKWCNFLECGHSKKKNWGTSEKSKIKCGLCRMGIRQIDSIYHWCNKKYKNMNNHFHRISRWYSCSQNRLMFCIKPIILIQRIYFVGKSIFPFLNFSFFHFHVEPTHWHATMLAFNSFLEQLIWLHSSAMDSAVSHSLGTRERSRGDTALSFSLCLAFLMNLWVYPSVTLKFVCARYACRKS